MTKVVLAVEPVGKQIGEMLGFHGGEGGGQARGHGL